MNEKIFGKRLRSLRQSKNLTMKELGKKFNLAESTISGYETGSRKPDMETTMKLADFFEVSIDYLYGRDDKDDSLFFFDLEGLTEQDLEDIKEHIEYVKWKSQQKEK